MLIELFGAIDAVSAWAETLLAVGSLVFLLRRWTLSHKQLRTVVRFAFVLAVCAAVDHHISGALSRPEVIDNYLTMRIPALEALIIASRSGYCLTVWLLVAYGLFRVVPSQLSVKGDTNV